MKKLIHEAHRRSLWQVLGIYLAGSWVALQVVAQLADSVGFPDWVEPFALVLLIIGLAKYLHDDPVVEGRKLKHMAIPFLLVALPMMLILRQPELGTALIICLIFISVMMLTKLKLRSMITLFLVERGILLKIGAKKGTYYILK